MTRRRTARRIRGGESIVALLLFASSCGSGATNGDTAAPLTGALTSLPDVVTSSTALSPDTTSITSTSPPSSAFVPDPPPPGATVCDRYGSIRAEGSVVTVQLTETSGIVASRATPGVLWAHNDSGSDAAVHAVATDGADLGTWLLEGVAALDFEDIAIGPGPEPDRDYLYVGDIGDNLAFRPDIVIYRVPEPDLGSPGSIAAVESIGLRYPGPPVDAEAIAVDPVTGDLFLLTKESGRSQVYRAAAETLTGSPVDLQPVARLELPTDAFVTAADFNTAGTVLALRGYEEVWMFSREELDPAVALSREPCAAPSPDESQGEALAFDPVSDDYYTVSEGLHPDVIRVTSR